jgi:AbrB family looped-hinge helix DNA binding protein
MPTSTLTSKGQITVPREVREHLQLQQGDRLEFEIQAGGQVSLRRGERGGLRGLQGILRQSGPPVSIEQMDEAIAAHVSREDRRVSSGSPAVLRRGR